MSAGNSGAVEANLTISGSADGQALAGDGLPRDVAGLVGNFQRERLRFGHDERKSSTRQRGLLWNRILRFSLLNRFDPSGWILIFRLFFALGDIAHRLSRLIAAAIFTFGGWAAGEFVAGSIRIIRARRPADHAIGGDSPTAAVEADEIGIHFPAAAFAIRAFS